MYNSKENKSAGILSSWERSRKVIEELKSSQKMELYSSKKDLDMNIFSRACAPGEREAWELNMCLPYGVCSDIVFNAGFLPRKEVKSLALGSYDMDEEEEELFAMLYDFGKSLGVKKVGMVLMDRATDGDLKACDLYLKYMGMLGGGVGEQDEEVVADAGINIYLDSGSGKGNGTGNEAEGELYESEAEIVSLPKEIE